MTTFPPYKINALSCLFTSQSEVMFYTQCRLLITVSWCSHPRLCCWTQLLSSGPGIVLAVWRKMILFTILLCSRYVLGPSRVTLPLSLLGTASPPLPPCQHTQTTSLFSPTSSIPCLYIFITHEICKYILFTSMFVVLFIFVTLKHRYLFFDFFRKRSVKIKYNKDRNRL